MNKSGRPQDPVWQFFTTLDNDTKVKCTTCGSAISDKIGCLRNHHAKCSSSEGDREVRKLQVLQQNNEPSTNTIHLNPFTVVQAESSFEQSFQNHWLRSQNCSSHR